MLGSLVKGGGGGGGGEGLRGGGGGGGGLWGGTMVSVIGFGCDVDGSEGGASSSSELESSMPCAWAMKKGPRDRV